MEFDLPRVLIVVLQLTVNIKAANSKPDSCTIDVCQLSSI